MLVSQTQKLLLNHHYMCGFLKLFLCFYGEKKKTVLTL